MKAILMLEDGRSFSGVALGAGGESIGALILNTAVVGYQEMVTDPSNANKILVLTYPLIGNYGCAPKFNQSKKAWLSGLVIKEESQIYSNWQARMSFDAFVKGYNLLTISEIDTRSLAVHLRQKGEMLGVISTKCFEPKELLAKISAFRKKKNVSLLPRISVNEPIDIGKGQGKKIGVLDLGVTRGILKQLETLGLCVTILPYNSSAQEILRLKLQGLIISSGPEEDPGLKLVAENIRPLINKLPILGISTGLQVLACALGAKITRMKLGHHGVNYPIQNGASYKAEITMQNHSYVVDADSLSKIKKVKITGFNLNDRTVEEIEGRKLKIIGTQYCPTSPGLDDVNEVFKRFVKLLKR